MCLALACLLALSLGSTTAQAEFGNVAFSQNEVFTPISYFDRDNMPCGDSLCADVPNGPTGSNTALVLKGYLIVMGSFDSGLAQGPLHVFDVSNPKQPVRVTTVYNEATQEHRELHAMPVAIVDGRYYLALPTRPQGVKFWDFTDPVNPTLAGEIELSNRGGDYDNSVWQISWTWPYLFVSGTGDGVYVVDTTDPTQPTSVGRIPTSQLGGQRIGPLHVVGNRLVVTNMDQTPMRVTVADVTDPTNAFQLASGTSPEAQYAALVVGHQLFSLGEFGNYTFWSWSDDGVDVVSRKTFGADKGGYCTYQDSFIFCGQSGEGLRKIDVSNMGNPTVVGTGDLDRANADTDFATVLGNMVYLGNDHGSGSALLPHQADPDTTPPAVIEGFPTDGATNLPLDSRLTVFLTDVPEMETVNEQTFVVRDAITCTPVDGVRSYSSFNAISFGTWAPLAADTTYEIVIPAGGLEDLAGNAIAEDSVIRFSTGAGLVTESCTGMDPGAGGAAGAGGTGGATTTGQVGVGGSGNPGTGGAGDTTSDTSGSTTDGSDGTTTGGTVTSGTGGSSASGSGSVVGSTTGVGQGGTGEIPPVIDGDASTTGQNATSAGDISPADAGSEAGCACYAPGRRVPHAGWLALLVAGLALQIGRRRPWRAGRDSHEH